MPPRKATKPAKKRTRTTAQKAKTAGKKRTSRMPKRKCPKCGRQISANNFPRHSAGCDGSGKPPSYGAKTRGAPQGLKMGRSKAVSAYLLAVRSNGNGAKPVSAERIAALETKAANASNPLRELRYRQQLIELSSSNRHDVEADFIEVAAAWAAEQPLPVTYAAFRDFGVPARVLKEAGITQ